MGIWKTTSIEETPELELKNWKIYKVVSPLWEGESLHFCGYNITEGEGRASSEIVVFDKSTRIGRTRSGRTYKLVGPPGYDPDGAYVWGIWCVRNQVDKMEDVSGEFYEL